MAKKRCKVCGNRVPETKLRDIGDDLYCLRCIKSSGIDPVTIEEISKPITKICCKCGPPAQSLDNFSIQYKYPSPWCKRCHAEYSREYRQSDEAKQKHREYMRKYRAKRYKTS